MFDIGKQNLIALQTIASLCQSGILFETTRYVARSRIRFVICWLADWFETAENAS
jgi:hypothetical protein